MSFSKLSILFILISFLFIIGCATGDSTRPSCCLFASPDFVLTSEKTAIERQIVGDYRELEKDAWMVSSVKTNVQKGKGVSATAVSDMEMLKAMKIRELHENKIRVYKDEGAIGEKNDGFITYRQHPKYENSSKNKKILSTIIKEENEARSIIFERSLIRSGIGNPDRDEKEAFGRMFAEDARVFAKKNDWIQEETGNWIRKK